MGGRAPGHAAGKRGELRGLRSCLHREQRQYHHRVRPHRTRRRRRPHRTGRGRRETARGHARQLPCAGEPGDRQGLRPFGELRRDPSESDNRPQVCLPGRLQEHSAQAPRPVQGHRQIATLARHSRQDQRQGQVRHRRVPAEHGVRHAGDSANPLFLEGAQHRRFGSEEDPRLHQGGQDRRFDGQMHGLGGCGGRQVPGRDESRQGAEGEVGRRSLREPGLGGDARAV